MKREEAKILLPIIQAYADGKEIEYKMTLDDTWITLDCPKFNEVPERYRIKPEPEYRLFTDCHELIQFWESHYCNSNRPKGTLPLIWVKRGEHHSLISSFDFPCNEVLIERNWHDMLDLFKGFTFLDGTPCGMVTDEQK